MTKAFRFKQFELRDDSCGMKIGADAVSLGAWSPFKNPRQIIDVGAGSGILSLMLAQRFPEAKITAIELDDSAAKQCQDNFDSSPFKNELLVINQDFRTFRTPTKFDCIICNPPFFKEEHENNNSQRNMARQSKFLPLDDFFKTCNSVSLSNTQISLVYPTEEEAFLLDTAHQSNWFPSGICVLKGYSSKKSKRSLYLFEKQIDKIFKHELSIELSRGKYTPGYKALVKEFYLNL